MENSFANSFTVAWGDCDAAGIVFYPNFFYWLDTTFQRLLNSRGLGQRELLAQFGAVTPIVDVGLSFRSPVTYDDKLQVTCFVAEWQERRFRLSYKIACAERLVAEGFEVRGWATPEGQGLRGSPIPDRFRRLLA